MTFSDKPKVKPAIPTLPVSPERLESGATKPGRIGVIRTQTRLRQIPMSFATAISAGLHVIVPTLLALLFILAMTLIAMLLNINPWDWLNPKKETKRDIEFVIVQNTEAKRPKTARLKGEFNQEAGGKPEPKKPPTPLEKPAQASAPKQAVQPQPQRQAQPQPAPKAATTPPKPQVAPQPKPQPQPPKQVAPQPPAPPVKQPAKQANDFKPSFTPTIPIPIAAGPKAPPTPKSPSPQGPVVNSSSATSASHSSGSPGPVSIPSAGPMASASHGRAGQQGSPGSRGGGNTGNPEAGPGRNPGVSVQEADFGPYMAELKRRLTRNWKPYRGDTSKRVVLKFDIGRDGRLMNMEVNQTSGEPLADEAAMNAVKISAPFHALPPEFEGDSVPILFTFDYTVYGHSSTSKRVNR